MNFPKKYRSIYPFLQDFSETAENSSRGWSVRASQILFDKSSFAQYKQGRLAEEIANIRLIRSEAELRMNVAHAYFDVLLNKDKLAALRSEKAAYAKQLEQAQEMFNAGAATRLDIYEAKAGYDAALSKEIETLTTLQTAENTLLNLTGLNPDKISIPFDNHLPDFLEQTGQHQWQEWARLYNPDWQLRRKELENAQAALEAAKGKRLPVLSADAAYRNHLNTHRSHTGSNQSFRNKGSSFNIQFSMPLYGGGRISSQIREAAAREMESRDLLVAAERNTRLAVHQAYSLTGSRRIQTLAQQKLLETNQAKLEATLLGRQLGVRNNLEEIQAQHAKADAEQKLAEAKYAYLQAYLQLLHHSGVLGSDVRTRKGIWLF